MHHQFISCWFGNLFFVNEEQQQLKLLQGLGTLLRLCTDSYVSHDKDLCHRNIVFLLHLFVVLVIFLSHVVSSLLFYPIYALYLHAAWLGSITLGYVISTTACLCLL